MNRPATILVVDDIAANRDTIIELLDTEGYMIVEAADGPTALRLAAEIEPDLVLLDVMMPGMNGYEVCRRLRADAHLAEMPVIIVTTLDDQASRLTGIGAGADDFITKPLNRAELRARTRTITRLNRYRRLRDAKVALQDSENRYEVLFDQSPLPMWLFEPETLRVLAVNESALQQYGYTREEFLRITLGEIYLPEDTEAMAKSFKPGSAGVKKLSEWRHRRKDETIFHVEVSARPLLLDGRTVQLMVTADITEKRLLQEQFRHVQRLESIGTLASGIAHDLNNMLAPIIFVAPLLRDSLSKPRDLKILDTLERSAERGAGLVRQILAFARSTTGEPRLTQVRHLAAEVISLVEETFPKSIKVEQRISSDAWPVMGNPTQLQQVLLNLCVNARDAMPNGGTLRIAAANRRLEIKEARAIPDAQPGAWLVLEISDTGSGIPKEVLTRIWEPFFTTKPVGKGTGLGLSTVRGIVAGHLGFIELQTAVGQGTTFRVFLPPAGNVSPDESDTAPSAIADGNGELILVVEDEDPIRDFVSTVLLQHGYRVMGCADGVEAASLFAVHSEKIALVITDVDMPKLGGAELARLLVQIRADVRLLVMSGLSGDDVECAAVKSARQLARAFLHKPFNVEDLLSIVHRLLQLTEETQTGKACLQTS